MVTLIAVVVSLAVGFGAGRIHNIKNFEAKVKAEVAKLVADAKAAEAAAKAKL